MSSVACQKYFDTIDRHSIQIKQLHNNYLSRMTTSPVVIPSLSIVQASLDTKHNEPPQTRRSITRASSELKPVSFSSQTRQPLVCVLLRHINNIPPLPTFTFDKEALSGKNSNSTKPLISPLKIRQHLSSLSSASNKLLYICDIPDDSFAVQLLRNLITEQKLSTRAMDTVRDSSRQNCSLMHICATRNNVQCMELLNKHGCNISHADSLGATPLFYAAAQNATDAAAFLIYKGANVNLKDSYNKTSLYVAFKSYSLPVADMLIMFKSNLDLKMTKGNTCLHMFAESGDVGLVKHLIEDHGCNAIKTNNDENNVLAVGCSQIDVVQYLCEYYKGQALYELVKNKNRSSENVLHICCRQGYFESLLVILAAMQNDNICEDKIVDILNEHDKKGFTPLITAVKHCSKKIIFFMCFCLEVNVDAVDSNGDTALHHAITSKDSLSCKLLAMFGCANLEIKNKNKMTCDMLSKKLDYERDMFEECKMMVNREREKERELKSFEKDRKRMQKEHRKSMDGHKSRRSSLYAFAGMFSPRKSRIFSMISPRRSKVIQTSNDEAQILEWIGSAYNGN
jgi:ankyrin repeat protein